MDLHFLSGPEESIVKNKTTFNNSIHLSILHRKGDIKFGKIYAGYHRKLLLSSAQLSSVSLHWRHSACTYVYLNLLPVFIKETFFFCQQDLNLASGLFCCIAGAPGTAAEPPTISSDSAALAWLLFLLAWLLNSRTIFGRTEKSSNQINGRQRFKVDNTPRNGRRPDEW